MDQNLQKSAIPPGLVAPAALATSNNDPIVANDNRDSEVVIKQTAPNTEAKFSAMTNGALNGAALGSLPMSMVALAAEWDKPGMKGKIAWSAIGTVVLAGIGGAWGWFEAKRLKGYRDTIANEVGRLENRLECLERIHTGTMVNRVEERKENTSSPSVA